MQTISRFLSLRGLLAGLLGLFAACTHAAQVPDMRPQQVSPSAWYVQGLSALGTVGNQNFISNAAFVITPAGVVVIDALGSPALAKQLIGEIGKLTSKPITHVFVTHYHADHIYGLQVFKALGAHIVAHRAAQAYIHSDTARLRMQASREQLAPWIDANTTLIEADEWVDGSKNFTVGGVLFQVTPVGPAHTPEDVVLYMPSEKVLFAGDLVFRSRIPFVGQADSRHWISALDQLLGFETQRIVPGHGPMSVDAKKDMRLTREYLAYLRASMEKATQDMEPFEEAYKNTDWTAFEHLPLFGIANRMNAYNTYLLLEQEAK